MQNKLLFTLTLFVVLFSGLLAVGEWKQKDMDLENNLSDQMAIKALIEIPQLKTDNLKFDQIIESKQQIVSGIKYWILARFSEPETNKLYKVQATLWVKSWEQYSEVLSFLVEEDYDEDDIDAQAIKFAQQAIRDRTNLMEQIFIFKNAEIIDKQLVSGTLYTIIVNYENNMNNQISKFKAKVYVVPWENRYELQDVEEIKEKLTSDDDDIDDDIIAVQKKAAAIAEQTIRAQTNLMSEDKYINYKVLDEKIVAGVIYTLQIVFENQLTNRKKLFEADVWVKAWEDFYEIKDMREVVLQQDESPKLVGGLSQAQFDPKNDENDARIVKCIENYMAKQNSWKNYTIKEYLDVQTQIVAGSMYVIEFEAQNTKTQQTKIFKAKVWDKPWESFTEVQNFEEVKKEEQLGASKSRRNLQLDIQDKEEVQEPMVGGWKKINFESQNSDTKNLVIETLNNYLNYQANFEGFTVSQITEAQVQVVAGVNYQLHIKLHKLDSNGSVVDTKEADVVVFCQTWENHAQVVKFDVTEEDNDDAQQMPGGWMECNFEEENDESKELAKNALNSYMSNSNDFADFTLKTVQTCKYQMVSGKKYMLNIKMSNSENVTRRALATVLVVEWENKAEVEEFVTRLFGRNDDEQTGSPAPGSFNPIDYNSLSESKRNLILSGLYTYIETQTNGEYLDYQVAEVFSAQVQIVAGEKYRLRIQLEKAPKLEGAPTLKKTVLVTIWVREWLEKAEVIDFTPKIEENHHVSGGWSIINFENVDEKERELIVSAINGKLSEELTTNTLIGFKFVQVLEAESQIVSGVNYKLKIKIGKDEETKIIELVIWVQQWTDTAKITSFKILEEQSNKKASTSSTMPGGYITIDFEAQNGQTKELVNHAINEYLQNSNTYQGFKLFKILNVQSHIVSGIEYRMKIEITKTDNNGKTMLRKALVQVWVQPWNNYSEVTSFIDRLGQDSASSDEELKQDGGWETINFNSENSESKDLVIKTINEYLNSNKNAEFVGFQFLQVTGAQKQIVQGEKYRLRIVISKDNIRRQIYCEIWVKEWENFGEVTEFVSKLQKQ